MGMPVRRGTARGASDIEPIRCTKCGGVVPLADAEHEQCPYCGNRTALPEEYRAAFRAQRDDGPTRARAEQTYRELSRRPSLVLRACAILFSGWTWLATGGLMVVAAMATADAGLLLIGVALHEHLLDVEPRSSVERWMLAGTIGLLALGTVLGAYGRKKALSTAALQAALSAHPPAREGGPAECRICGAPLSVPTDALGVRCTYCGSDNLVAAPAKWLRKVVATTLEVAQRAADAARALTEEHQRLRKSALVRAGVTVGAFLALIGLLELTLPPHLKERDPNHFGNAYGPRFSDHLTPRTLVRRVAVAHQRSWGLYVPGPGLGACAPETPLRVRQDECDAGVCTVWLFAALRRGDKLTLRSSTLPAGTRVRFKRHHIKGANWPMRPSESFGTVEAEDTIGGAHVATLTATWSSWYEIALFVPESSSDKATLCIEVQ